MPTDQKPITVAQAVRGKTYNMLMGTRCVVVRETDDGRFVLRSLAGIETVVPADHKLLPIAEIDEDAVKSAKGLAGHARSVIESRLIDLTDDELLALPKLDTRMWVHDAVRREAERRGISPPAAPSPTPPPPAQTTTQEPAPPMRSPAPTTTATTPPPKPAAPVAPPRPPPTEAELITAALAVIDKARPTLARVGRAVATLRTHGIDVSVERLVNGRFAEVITVPKSAS